MGIKKREDIVQYIAEVLVNADNPSGAYAGSTEFSELPDENEKDPLYSKRYYQNLARRMCDYRDMLVGEPGHVRTMYDSCPYPAPYPLEIPPVTAADIEKIRPLGHVIKKWVVDVQQTIRDLICAKRPIIPGIEVTIKRREDLNHIEVDTNFDKLDRCPACNSKGGFFSIDSMETYACCHCGARFLATPFGLTYVGDWPTYALNDRWDTLPIDKVKEADDGL